ncbi:uncharacterized protein FIBRA_04864 [Fibroporia radiculosa]|uniref:Homeobox domain-containing protein n=1 Tax=Fibroporia radiculosa TaxID=599839 RepID=J4IAE2_9APHY|nr:uncharacterized protein FIBRA_04864 [Fibroporia radiculosa]CCM02756.1 predicted protein [Fibroporia radiculosa]
MSVLTPSTSYLLESTICPTSLICRKDGHLISHDRRFHSYPEKVQEVAVIMSLMLVGGNSSTVISQSSNRPSTVSIKAEQSKSERARRQVAQKAHDAMRKKWKARALKVSSAERTIANWFQSAVMAWAYAEVTPYPDDVWTDLLSIAVNRTPRQVRNWFSDKRQMDARQEPRLEMPSNRDMRLIKVDNRLMRVRPGVLRMFDIAEDTWTDLQFETALEAFARTQEAKKGDLEDEHGSCKTA